MPSATIIMQSYLLKATLKKRLYPLAELSECVLNSANGSCFISIHIMTIKSYPTLTQKPEDID